MKAYIITTGVVFALLTLIHIWRIFVEGAHALNPFFVVITIVAGALSLWAGRLLMRTTGS